MSQVVPSNDQESYDNFLIYHFVGVVFALLSILFIIEIFDIDLIVSDYIYNSLGGKWVLRDNFVTATLLHNFAQKTCQGMAVLILGLALSSHVVSCLSSYKKGLWLVFLSLFFSAAIVGTLKEITNVHCPWDLIRFGGIHQYVSVYASSDNDSIRGHCFPAGHASAGYGYVVFYFLFLHHKRGWKWHGLSFGLILGFAFGFTQQLRGAHFLSHDVWTILVCWLTALLFYSILLKEKRNV